MPWFDCFKNSRPPLQELEQISLRIDGAILVGTMDDKAVIRKQEWTQMRDNVLYEYGMFSGILGRSKCGLLVPDEEKFKIPSDFLGVSCYEAYNNYNIEKTILSIIDSLNRNLSKPPIDETTNSRGRRLLQLVGWLRNESFRLAKDWKSETGKELVSNRIIAISGFIKDDIDKLNLNQEYQKVEEVILESAKTFPKNLGNRRSENLKDGINLLIDGVTPNGEVLEGLLYEMEKRGIFNNCHRHCKKCFYGSWQERADWFWKRKRFEFENQRKRQFRFEHGRTNM